MGSFARKKRRQIARQWATSGETKKTAEEYINAIRDNKAAVKGEAKKIATDALGRYREKMQQDMRDSIIPRVQGDMIYLFLYCLYTKWGFDPEKLTEAAADLWAVIGEMQAAGVTGNALVACIKDETGLDVAEIFARSTVQET
jgi:hypothetical protein